MKRLLSLIFAIVLCFGVVFSLTACGETDNPGEKPAEREPVKLEDVVIENTVVTYDGAKHLPTLPDLSADGITCTLKSKVGKTDPGSYDYGVKLTKGEETITVQTKLIIEKITPVLTADAEQVFYLNDGPARPTYSVTGKDLDKNIACDEVVFTEAGSYEITLKTNETKLSKVSNEVKVKVIVKSSHSGAYLENKTVVVDGETPYTLEVCDLDPKYTVEYENNVQTLQGVYFVTATIKEGSTVVDTLKATLSLDYADDPDFAAYEQETFVYYIEGDQLTINIFMADYESFGVERGDATWYAYEPYGQEEFESDLEEVQRLRKEYNDYCNKKLSFKQLNSLATIDKMIKSYEVIITSLADLDKRQTYVDQYGGYCADFPSQMEAWTIRTEADIVDMISYIDSTYDAYMSYYDYILYKKQAGYPLSTFTLVSFSEYLEGVFLKDYDAGNKSGDIKIIVKEQDYTKFEELQGTDYYLYDVCKKKIDESQEKLGLDASKVQEYQTQLETAFNEKFMPAHKDLAVKVRAFVNDPANATDDVKEGYLSVYEGGTEVYAAMLQSRLGIYGADLNKYESYLKGKVSTYLNKYKTALSSSNSAVENILDGKTKVLTDSSIESQLAYLKEFAKTIAPELDTVPEIAVIYMDDSLTANTTTAAYYMKSALDYFDAEYIHLNPKSLSKNYLDTLMTLAHEGYPGHLYAYVSTKENQGLSNLSRISTCTGHGEGWSKYVEIALANYIAGQKDSADWTNAMNQYIYNELFSYSLYAYLDFGVNYRCWTPDDIDDYMGTLGFSFKDTKDIWRMLIEAPSQYAPYGYGMDKFYDYHTQAKALLGDYYNEVEFNRVLLEHGWVGLGLLDEYVSQYLAKQAFLYGLDQ